MSGWQYVPTVGVHAFALFVGVGLVVAVAVTVGIVAANCIHRRRQLARLYRAVR